MKMNLKKLQMIPLGLFSVVFCLLALTACDGSTTVEDYVGVQKTDPYDPSKPVVISNFIPESGSVGQQVVIYGSNFGNDPEKINLTIGGKKAIVVSVKGDCLYTFIPSGAFTGEIEISIDGSTPVKSATAFAYERKMVVGTLCGYKNALDNQGWQEGPFETCSGFRNDGVMQFSPYNHDQLFIVYDQEPHFGTVAHSIQLLDLKERTVRDVLPLSLFNQERLRTIDFIVDPFAYTADGENLGRAVGSWESIATADELRWREHLIISADNDDSNFRANSVYIVDRDANGEFSETSKVTKLACYRQCNGASVHPNGEIYFTSYQLGEVIRLDTDYYWQSVEDGEVWNPYVTENELGAFEILYTIQDRYWEFQIDIHPTGDYAYIVVINQHYILRTDYDWESKRFLPPYQIAGQMKSEGFVDGVGKSAQVRRPYQGTFVKNDSYEALGKSDVYDFYFCDSRNNALRYLTPDGIIGTYAGGNANSHADGNTYGSENGELRDVARFYRPTVLVNDFHIDKITGEKTLIFYILDTENHLIRTITMEEEEDVSDNEPEETEE